MTLSTQTSAPPLARPYAWNLVSLDYTRDFAPHCAEYAVDALDLVRVPAGARVLDVATGPGTLAFVAARRGLSVTAVDFSADMIALLRGRAAAEGMDHRILAREGDGEALPFAESTFDAAFSLFGLMFFADRARGLSELHRVLVPG
ncbi:MAG TPA: methyltransferase domain-containing protein, partial [Polyangiaceae bacterium]